MDTDADATTQADGPLGRFSEWYGDWYLRLYAVLALCIVLAAGYGYAIDVLSWWNAGAMVGTLLALSAFIWWRRGVDPAFDA